MRFRILVASALLLSGAPALASPARAFAHAGGGVTSIRHDDIMQTFRSMKSLFVESCKSHTIDRNRIKRMKNVAFDPYQGQWPPTFRLVIGSFLGMLIAQPDPCSDDTMRRTQRFLDGQVKRNIGKLYLEYIGDKKNVDHLARNMYVAMSRELRSAPLAAAGFTG